MRKIIPTWIALVFLLLPAAFSQSLTAHPGYADLASLELAMGDEPKFDVDFDHDSLAALLAMSDSADERLTALVEGVESVRARVFELGSRDAEDVRRSIEDTATQLKDQGWSTLASVRDDAEQIDVFLRLQGERIVGVTAFFWNGDEAGFANVVGDVGMADVMALAPNVSGLRRFLGDMKDEGETGG